MTVAASSAAGQVPDNRRWSVALAAPPKGAPVVSGTIAAVPLRTGGVSGHRVETGEQVWRAELDAEQPLAADDERIYVVAGDAIHALAAKTGEVAWRASIGGAATATPVAHSGWVIVAVAGELLALRAVDGTPVWHKPVGDVTYPPAIDGDLLVVPLKANRLVALDIQTGERRWESRDLGAPPLEPLAIADRVYVGTENKLFLILHASTGRIDTPWKLGALPRGHAAVDARHVYFVAMDNTVRAIDRGNANERWRKGVSYRPGDSPFVTGAAVVIPARDVPSLQTFNARTGAPGIAIDFSDRLAALPVFFLGPSGPSVIGATGNLQNEWKLQMLEPAPLPSMAVGPLESLPGEVLALPAFTDR